MELPKAPSMSFLQHLLGPVAYASGTTLQVGRGLDATPSRFAERSSLARSATRSDSCSQGNSEIDGASSTSLPRTDQTPCSKGLVDRLFGMPWSELGCDKGSIDAVTRFLKQRARDVRRVVGAVDLGVTLRTPSQTIRASRSVMPAIVCTPPASSASFAQPAMR